MFANFGAKEASCVWHYLTKLRQAGICTELYPDAVKLKKQLSYADAKKIPYVALVGETEIAACKLNLKNMLSGEQQLVTIEELIQLMG